MTEPLKIIQADTTLFKCDPTIVLDKGDKFFVAKVLVSHMRPHYEQALKNMMPDQGDEKSKVADTVRQRELGQLSPESSREVRDQLNHLQILAELEASQGKGETAKETESVRDTVLAMYKTIKHFGHPAVAEAPHR